MKEFALDESLSEEARDSARKGLEVLVSSQLLDIEQAAELKKLQSEAMAEAHKVEVAALAKAKTAEATIKLQAAEMKEMEAEAAAEVKRMEAEATAEATKMETEAQSKRKKANATGLSEDMMGWLQRNRLQQCATDLARIAGEYEPTQCEACLLHLIAGCSAYRTVLPSDLQYLTDEDVEEIGMPCSAESCRLLLMLMHLVHPTGGALTRVEKKRLQAAVKAQCGAPLLLSRT